jgi:hypothetical protein
MTNNGLEQTPEARAQRAWDMLEAGVYDDPAIRAALRADVQTGEANGMVFADTPLPNAPAPEMLEQEPEHTPAILVITDAPNPYILSYGVAVERDEADHNSAWYTVSLTKELHGADSLTDSRAIGTYRVYEGGDDLATSTARDLTQLKDDVELLTGSPVEGARAMVSMAHQIALDNGMIAENEPFFADERLPADPFELQNMALLLEQYQAMNDITEIENEEFLNQNMDAYSPSIS